MNAQEPHEGLQGLVLRRLRTVGHSGKMTVAVAAAAILAEISAMACGIHLQCLITSGTLLLLFNHFSLNLNMERQLMVSPYARETWIATSSDSGRTFSRVRNLTHLQSEQRLGLRKPWWRCYSAGRWYSNCPWLPCRQRLEACQGPFRAYFLELQWWESWARGLDPIGVDENSAVRVR